LLVLITAVEDSMLKSSPRRWH